MTIERLYTIDDDIDTLRKAFPEYSLWVSNDSFICFYERGWFGRLIAIFDRVRLSCVCNNEVLALKLDVKYPKLKIKLYTELVNLKHL
jgi:hypothetical protein